MSGRSPLDFYETAPWQAMHSYTGNGRNDSATTEWLMWAKPGVVIANPWEGTPHTSIGPGLGGWIGDVSITQEPGNGSLRRPINEHYRYRYPLRGGNG